MNREIFAAVLSGLIFGAGLAISGMADPMRVKGFLDILGNWDPTLLFVMGGAILVMMFAWAVQRKMSAPFFRSEFSLPSRTDVDRSLVIGAVLFGTGWGIAGLCPGPGVIGLVFSPTKAIIFIIAMIIGMFANQIIMFLSKRDD